MITALLVYATVCWIGSAAAFGLVGAAKAVPGLEPRGFLAGFLITLCFTPVVGFLFVAAMPDRGYIFPEG